METTAKRQHCLTAMGIQSWQRRDSALSSDSPQEVSGNAAWTTLQQTVAACTACGLEKTRTQTVFGVGNQQAKLMIIGEAPGFNEDRQGEPFVGAAGQLLDAMLQTIGFDRSNTYIANILKCRPPNNRDPKAEEVALCTPYLRQQIALLQPTLLLAVGRIAAQYLLNTKTSLGKLRCELHDFQQTPLLVTYHPAYLLRNPKDKSKAFSDLQLTAQTLQTLSNKQN